MPQGYALGSYTGHPVFNKTTGAFIYNKLGVSAVKAGIPEWHRDHPHSYKNPQVKLSYNSVLALTLGTIKLSVILLYRRIFIGRLFNHYTLALCALIAFWSLSFIFATAFQCDAHIECWWSSISTMREHCVDTAALSLGFGISDVITDLMVLAIPLPIIWKL